jgi:hypothetical protein
MGPPHGGPMRISGRLLNLDRRRRTGSLVPAGQTQPPVMHQHLVYCAPMRHEDHEMPTIFQDERWRVALLTQSGSLAVDIELHGVPHAELVLQTDGAVHLDLEGRP